MYQQQLPAKVQEYSLLSSTHRYPIIKCFAKLLTIEGRSLELFLVITTKEIFNITDDDDISPLSLEHDNANTKIGDFIIHFIDETNRIKATLDHGNQMIFIDSKVRDFNSSIKYPIYHRLVKLYYSSNRIFFIGEFGDIHVYDDRNKGFRQLKPAEPALGMVLDHHVFGCLLSGHLIYTQGSYLRVIDQNTGAKIYEYPLFNYGVNAVDSTVTLCERSNKVLVSNKQHSTVFILNFLDVRNITMIKWDRPIGVGSLDLFTFSGDGCYLFARCFSQRRYYYIHVRTLEVVFYWPMDRQEDQNIGCVALSHKGAQILIAYTSGRIKKLTVTLMTPIRAIQEFSALLDLARACPICLSPLAENQFNLVQASCCAQYYCHSCLEQAMHNNPTCPNCREPLGSMPPPHWILH